MLSKEKKYVRDGEEEVKKKKDIHARRVILESLRKYAGKSRSLKTPSSCGRGVKYDSRKRNMHHRSFFVVTKCTYIYIPNTVFEIHRCALYRLAPPQTTSREVVEKAAKMLRLRSSDVVYDIGCGKGKISYIGYLDECTCDMKISSTLI